MEIEVGKIYRVKRDIHCYNGSFLPKGITCVVVQIFPRIIGKGTDVKIRDNWLKCYWFVDTDYLEEVEKMEKDKNIASAGQHEMKILITFADATTVAQLLKGNETVKTANAKCAPDDKFSIEVGAKLALKRLFEKKEKNVLIMKGMIENDKQKLR